MQRIRTEAEIPFSVALLDFKKPPLYQALSEKVLQMKQLGMNVRTIAKLLKVDDKVVKRALKWLSAD